VRLWRVSRYASLDGAGGLAVAGRWHIQGRPITYCSLHPATALLEWIVHLELYANKPSAAVPFIVIEAPDDISREQLTGLPTDWRTNQAVTQAIGDEWLKSGRTAMLVVPSALVPQADNMLINPAHRDVVRIRIVESRIEPFDMRLRRP
jgi:RES domain-containing protein